MKCTYYLEDVIYQIICNASELKETAKDEFETGKLFGYYEIISILLNQAETFEIKEDLPSKVKDFDPYSLLSVLPKKKDGDANVPTDTPGE